MEIRTHQQENSWKAMLTLLDDPDPRVCKVVYNKLLLEGEPILGFLELHQGLAESLEQHDKIGEIISAIRIGAIAEELLAWKRSVPQDALAGAYLVSRVVFPEISFNTILARIERIMADLWIETHPDQTAIEKTLILNRIFFGKYLMQGHLTPHRHPDDFFLHRVLERKKGDELLIGILYQTLAQRLHIPLKSVILPGGAFLLAYMDNDEPADSTAAANVLFYIYPLRRGIVLEQSEILRFMETHRIEPRPLLFEPTPFPVMIELLIRQLSHLYKLRQMPGREREFQQLLARYTHEEEEADSDNQITP